MRRGERRSQVSMEYLFVMTIAFLITVPLIILYYTQAARLADESNAAMGRRAVLQIAEAADTVYYLGPPSTRTFTVSFPDNVLNAMVSEKSVTLLIDSSHGDYEENAWSAANLTGSISTHSGPHVLTVRALPGGVVNISEE